MQIHEIEVEEKTLNRAIQIGLQKLGLSKEEVKIEVLHEALAPEEQFKVRLSSKLNGTNGAMGQAVETEGRTMNHALHAGLRQLGLKRDEVKIEILHEPVVPGEQFKIRVVPKANGAVHPGAKEKKGRVKPTAPPFNPVQVFVSDDEMEAYLTLRLPPKPVGNGVDTTQQPGPSDLQIEGVKKMISDARIAVGIDETAIAQGIEKYRGGREVLSLRIAKGQAVQEGTPTQIEIHVHAAHSEGEESETHTERVDFKEKSFVQNVAPGTHLVTRRPGTPPAPGFSVKGRLIAPRPWSDQRLTPGKGVRAVPQADGSVHFVSNAEGVLLMNREKVEVVDLLVVDGNVDFSTGNINFSGSVRVKGHVLSGFTVEAGGDIHVGGEVEAATLKAGGSIYLATGVLGQDQAEIWARGEVKARYIQRAKVFAGTDVRVGEEVIGSLIIAGQKVEISSGKGGAIGGEIIAGETIDIRRAGSPSAPLLVLKAGRDCRKEFQAYEIGCDIRQSEQVLEQLREKACRSDSRKSRQDGESKLSHKIKNVEDGLKLLTQKRNKLLAEAAILGKGRIQIREKLFPKVDVMLGPLRESIVESSSGVVFRPDSNGRSIVQSVRG